MRPEDRYEVDAAGRAFDGLDADLMDLDAVLADAGRTARRRTSAQARPDPRFAAGLRSRLLASPAAPGAPAVAGPWNREPGREWEPERLAPRVRPRPAAATTRPRWAFLAAAAALATAVAVGAANVRFDRVLPPPPSAEPSVSVLASPSASTPAVTAQPSPTVLPPVATIAPPDPTAEPTPKATPKPTPKPTSKPTPKPTPKAEPTIGTLALGVEGCPGANLLAWSGTADAYKYRVFRSASGEVGAAYPPDGATLVAKTPGLDGFDIVAGGSTAWYRVFAFDIEDHVLASSPSKSMTAVSAIAIGGFAAAGGPGSIDASWTPAPVQAACFSYGKLVASTTSDNPSYVKGDPYLAVLENPEIAAVQVTGLDPATRWVRYEYIRSTSIGAFVVGRTAVVSVTVE